MMSGMGGGGGMGGFGGLSGLADFGFGLDGLILLLVAGAIFLILFVAFKKMTDRQADARTGSPNRTLEILKERYAWGELDEKSFGRMRKELE
jgi:putative membrane protein